MQKDNFLISEADVEFFKYQNYSNICLSYNFDHCCPVKLDLMI